MNLLSLDHIIVYGFLLATLMVGLHYGKGIKTLRNYAVADRSYSGAIISITLIATLIGAGTIIGGLIEAIDSNFLYVLALIGNLIGAVLLSIFFAPKFDNRFVDCISIGDILGKVLGKIEIRTACILMMIQSVGVLGAQLTVMGHICQSFLGLSYEYSVVLTSAIVIAYSTFGGIRSVTMTDVLQFFVLMIAIPMISTVLLNDSKITLETVSTHFQFSMFEDKVGLFDYLALAVFCAVPLNFFSAPLVQRYLMVKSVNVSLSKVTFGFALMEMLMLVLLLVTTTCFLKLYPSEDPSEIISIILENHFSTGMKGLVLAGVIAVIMSTADSALNASSVLLVKNVLPEQVAENEKKSLFITKIVTFVIGISAALMALQSFKPVTLLIYAHTLLAAGSSIPLTAGLFGFKVNRESFWISLLVAGVTYALSQYTFPEYNYIHSLFMLIASVLSFVLSHVIINKGFARDPNMEVIRRSKKRRGAAFTFSVPNLRSIEKSIFRKFSKKSTSLTLFASFCYMNFLYCLLLFATADKDGYMHIETLFVIAISAFFCTLLLLKDMWSVEDQKKYLGKAWLFCLCFCIPCVNTVLLVDTHGSIYSIILLTIGFLLLSYLVDWFLFVVISLVGVCVGSLFELAMFGSVRIDIPKHMMVAYFTSLVIVSVVMRYRQSEDKERIKTLELFGSAMAREAKAPMNSFVMNNNLLQDITKDCIVLDYDDTNYRIQLSAPQYEMLRELPNFNDTIGRSGRISIDLLLLAMKADEMRAVEDYGEYSVKECIDETVREFVIDEEQKKRINIDIKKNFTFKGSRTFMKATVINLIKNAFKHGGAGVAVDVIVDKGKLVVRDNGHGIPFAELDRIFDKYYTLSGEGAGVGLALCSKFMDSIGGSINCYSKEGEYTEFALEFKEF